VENRFSGGEHLCGTVIIEMPEARKRLFDFVYAIKNLFELHTAETSYLINVAQVRDISPI